MKRWTWIFWFLLTITCSPPIDAAAQDRHLPDEAALQHGLNRLFAGRPGRFQRLAQGARCEVTRVLNDGVVMTCRKFDGCIRACMDRELVATIRVTPHRWRLLRVQIQPADTGACGDCMEGR